MLRLGTAGLNTAGLQRERGCPSRRGEGKVRRPGRGWDGKEGTWREGSVATLEVPPYIHETKFFSSFLGLLNRQARHDAASGGVALSGGVKATLEATQGEMTGGVARR